MRAPKGDTAYKKRDEEGLSEIKKKCHVKTKAEIGMMFTRAKGCQQITRSEKKGMNRSFPSAFSMVLPIL